MTLLDFGMLKRVRSYELAINLWGDKGSAAAAEYKANLDDFMVGLCGSEGEWLVCCACVCVYVCV